MYIDVACALSALAAARPTLLRKGVPSSGRPVGLISGPSCMTAPVTPVAAIRIASSIGLRGDGAFALLWDKSAELSETPCATRRVRRSCIACMSGYEKRSFRPALRSALAASPAKRFATGAELVSLNSAILGPPFVIEPFMLV